MDKGKWLIVWNQPLKKLGTGSNVSEMPKRWAEQEGIEIIPASEMRTHIETSSEACGYVFLVTSLNDYESALEMKQSGVRLIGWCWQINDDLTKKLEHEMPIVFTPPSTTAFTTAETLWGTLGNDATELSSALMTHAAS